MAIAAPSMANSTRGDPYRLRRRGMHGIGHGGTFTRITEAGPEGHALAWPRLGSWGPVRFRQ